MSEYMSDGSFSLRQDTAVYDTLADKFCEKCAYGEIEIDVVSEGNGMHAVFGKAVPCKAGDVYVINSGVPHGYFADEGERLTVRRIFFDARKLFDGEAAICTSKDFCYGVFSENAISAYAMLTARIMERIESLYDAIKIESVERKADWQSAIKAYLSLMLIIIGRYVNRAIKNSIPKADMSEWNPVSATILAVKENFGDADMTLESIAGSFFMSKSHLSRLFKQFTGENFSDHLRRVRLEGACRMLKETGYTVTEIMEMCGMRDATSFYKSFNDYVGMTPNNYRKINQKNMEGTMSIFAEISENLQKGRAKAVKELVQKALDEGISAKEILDGGLVAGMNIVGEKFKNNEIYVPEVLVAARAMNMGAQLLKPHLATSGVVARGKVCLGTVQGDLHDIGKNLVKMMMEGKGLEVIDLGTDVAPETFVQAAIENECQVICCSALLTTTMDAMADVVKAADAAGIRDKIKIMIGGAPVSEEFCRQIGADCYTPDAASAADAAEAFCRA